MIPNMDRVQNVPGLAVHPIGSERSTAALKAQIAALIEQLRTWEEGSGVDQYLIVLQGGPGADHSMTAVVDESGAGVRMIANTKSSDLPETVQKLLQECPWGVRSGD